MTAQFDALLASISGGPVLNPADLAAAVAEGRSSGRLDEIVAAVSTKPAPKIPPRYESELRTWVARSVAETDPSAARLQAYAAVHLDPHNGEAISALDDALNRLGPERRHDTWSALVHTYPDVQVVREAATGAGCALPDPLMQVRAAKAERRRRARRTGQAVLVDASSEGDQGGAQPAATGASTDKGRPEKSRPDKSRKDRGKDHKRPRPTGIAALVPALEPDAVRADRLAALAIASGLEWKALGDPASDPLTWATNGGEGEPPPDSPATSDIVAILRGGDRLGPIYGRLVKRLKGTPAIVIWAARRELAAGDVDGARRSRERLAPGEHPAFAADVADVDEVLRIAGGDVDAGWAAWEAGTLPDGLRAPLARALVAADREVQADEVLGLPDLRAADVSDPAILTVRFDLMYADGDADGALEQAWRLTDLRPGDPGAEARLWLGLAAAGRHADIADRSAGADADTAAVLRAARPMLDARVRRLLSSLSSAVVSARSDLQELAKGRTIRDPETFASAAERARGELDALAEPIALVGPLDAGEYPAAQEDLVTLLASADGRAARLSGSTVVVGERAESADLLASEAVRGLAAPAEALTGRGDLLRSLVTRASELLDVAVTESARTDIARRRVEERVARSARAAADALSLAVNALDVSKPAPVVPAADVDLDADAGSTEDGAPLEVETADSVTEPEATESAPEAAAESAGAELPEAESEPEPEPEAPDTDDKADAAAEDVVVAPAGDDSVAADAGEGDEDENGKRRFFFRR